MSATSIAKPFFAGSDRERLTWLLLLCAAAFLRFYDLGARVMTHDESIHAFYAFELLRSGGYSHDPVYHGPLLYHLNALVFYFLGASDATARVSSALAGVGLIASIWLFRPFLGRAGALGVALVVAASPALLFYSRQVWMDVHVALFSMLWIYSVFRYLADRSRRWLYLMTAAMVLAFTAKEVAFIFGAIVGAWLAIELYATRRRDPARAAAAGDLAVLMFGLVLPFSSGAAYLGLGWSVRDTSPRGLLVVGALVAAGAGLVWLWLRLRRRILGPAPEGWLRLRDWAVLMILFWGFALLLFTTLFTKVPAGLVSGVVGSLGYWLTQHEIARGSQPWFYYLMLTVLYEPLALLGGVIALVAGAARLRRPSWDPASGDAAVDGDSAEVADGDGAIGVIGAAIGRADRRSFFSFLLWWAIASWCAYTFAGEKMPWLVTHMVLPLAVLAGWGLARLLLAARTGARAGARIGAGVGSIVLFGGGLVLPVLVSRWLGGQPFSGATSVAVAETMAWIVRSGVIAVLLAFMVRAASRAGARQAGRLVVLGVAALLLLLTVRAGLRLCYLNYDLATEHLSYAQGSPDVKRALREIQLISERSAGDRNVFVAYDDQSSWPFVWYLRDYPKSRTWGTQPNFAQGAAVILTGPKNRDAIWPLVASGYVKREYRLIWWPRQDYSGMGPRALWQLLRDPDRRHKLWRMAVDHDYSHIDAVKWDPRQDFDMYVREDVAPLGLAALGIGDFAAGDSTAGMSGAAAAGTRLEPQPRLVLTGPYDGVSLSQPTDITIAADGSRVVVDSGNHRIVVLELDGTMRRAFGGKCDIAQGEPSGCVDPDGAGPLALGDGQLNEPWGVAAGPAGEIFVSDTWNHRIQRFDPQGRFTGKWGLFGNAPVTGAPPVDEPFFYGPRGIATGLDSDLVVADTGNKRLVSFSLAGEYRRTLGSGGAGPEQWNEPVGIVPDTNGTLLVADTWNHRVKRLDRRYATIATWRVPDWRSEGVLDKPFLTVDGSGTVYAGDPAGGRVWVFEPSGRLAATLVLPPPATGPPRPLGMAVDSAAGELLVVDQAGGRVLVFALPMVEAGRSRP